MYNYSELFCQRRHSKELYKLLDIRKDSHPVVPLTCVKVDVDKAKRSNSMTNRNLLTIDVVEAVVAALELTSCKEPWLIADAIPELKIEKGEDVLVIYTFSKWEDEVECFFSKDEFRCEVANIKIDRIKNPIIYETKLGNIDNWYGLKKCLWKTVIPPLKAREAYLELTKREYDINSNSHQFVNVMKGDYIVLI